MSNKNVLKTVFTIFENESGASREIDSNDLIDIRIKEFRKKEEELRRKKEKELLDSMTPEEREEYEQSQDGELEGLFTDPEESLAGEEASFEMQSEILEEARAQADAVLAEASARADEIMAEASERAESMKEQAIKEGQKQGYDMGQAMAMGEIDCAKADMAAEIDRIRQEYTEKELSMEREVLDVVCDVMNKFFMIEFGDKKEILSHLCENAIASVESSNTLIIRVNDKNKEHLSANKDDIQSKVGENVQLDVVMDPLLGDDQCIIECDGGIIDCSIGVELDNFIKDLRALSI